MNCLRTYRSATGTPLQVVFGIDDRTDLRLASRRALAARMRPAVRALVVELLARPWHR